MRWPAQGTGTMTHQGVGRQGAYGLAARFRLSDRETVRASSALFAVELRDRLVEFRDRNLRALTLPTGGPIGRTLRKHDESGEAIRVLSDGVRQTNRGLTNSVVAVIESTMEDDDNGPRLGPLKLARDIHCIPVLDPCNGDVAIEKPGFRGLSNRDRLT